MSQCSSKPITRNARGWRIGESHHKAKHPDADIALIVELHDVYGLGYKTLSKKFDIPARTIRRWCNGENRTAVTTQ